MEIMAHIRDLMDYSLHFQPPWTWMWSFLVSLSFVPLLCYYFSQSKTKETTCTGSDILHAADTFLLYLIKCN